MSVYHLAECVGPPNFLGIICNEESNSVGFDLHSTWVDLNFGLYRTFRTFKNVLQTNLDGSEWRNYSISLVGVSPRYYLGDGQNQHEILCDEDFIN